MEAHKFPERLIVSPLDLQVPDKSIRAREVDPKHVKTLINQYALTRSTNETVKVVIRDGALYKQFTEKEIDAETLKKMLVENEDIVGEVVGGAHTITAYQQILQDMSAALRQKEYCNKIEVTIYIATNSSDDLLKIRQLGLRDNAVQQIQKKMTFREQLNAMWEAAQTMKRTSGKCTLAKIFTSLGKMIGLKNKTMALYWSFFGGDAECYKLLYALTDPNLDKSVQISGSHTAQVFSRVEMSYRKKLFKQLLRRQPPCDTLVKALHQARIHRGTQDIRRTVMDKLIDEIKARKLPLNRQLIELNWKYTVEN